MEYFNQIMILKYIIMNVLHMVLVKIGQGGHNFSMHDGHYCIPGYSMKTYPLSHIELVQRGCHFTEPTQDNAIHGNTNSHMGISQVTLK